MSSNYRTYDCSTNIILSAKTSAYKPYKSVKQKNNLENKRVQPLHIKIFDRPKKNQRIMSRNDRMDLFLEGGNFSQTRQASTKSHIDRSLYKIARIKKKQDIFAPLRSQTRTNGWHTTTNNSTHGQDNQKLMKSGFFNFVHTAEQSRKKSQIVKEITEEGHMHQRKSVENMHSVRIDSPVKDRDRDKDKEKKQTNVSPVREKTQQNIITFHSRNEQTKITLKNFGEKALASQNISSSQNQLKKINKIAKPLFYLQPKQISHIRAESFIVTEFPSGQLVFGNYFKKTGEIASLTKIMTFYTVYQIADRFAKDVTVESVEIDEEAQSMTGTSAEIFMGDVYTIQQLFYGLMLPSGNDAATALAKWGGALLQANDPLYKSESKNTEVKTFIRYMNAMAKKCGMKASKFCNPHGLPHPQSCSNAEDLACLVQECLKIDLFRTVIKTKRYNCWVEHKGVKHEVIWENTNKLLRRPNFIGGKTGVTVSAGPCLVSCYQLHQRILIVILLRTNKLSRRFKETRFILALAMTKLDRNLYRDRIKQVLKNDAELDSDNSDDQQQFNYERNDAKQMAKRNKILTFQM